MVEERIRIKPYPETHQQGFITVEQKLFVGLTKGDFGIQIASDGRVWVCIDGNAVIRFKPNNEWGKDPDRIASTLTYEYRCDKHGTFFDPQRRPNVRCPRVGCVIEPRIIRPVPDTLTS